ncbi:hypothetical protein ScPMuIL_000642 [Solemya velum]
MAESGWIFVVFRDLWGHGEALAGADDKAAASHLWRCSSSPVVCVQWEKDGDTSTNVPSVLTIMSDEAAPSRTSSVLTRFTKNQIQEMKEAFTMIDQDRDGVISMGDLKEMYQSFGTVPQDKQLEEMLKDAPGALNFTMFLSLFSDKLSGSDPESALINAFQMFDPENKGFIPEEYMKDLLENVGDNFNKDEMRGTFKEAPMEGGKFDYVKFSKIVKGSSTDDE